MKLSHTHLPSLAPNLERQTKWSPTTLKSYSMASCILFSNTSMPHPRQPAATHFKTKYMRPDTEECNAYGSLEIVRCRRIRYLRATSPTTPGGTPPSRPTRIGADP